jgi:hypothetical protein
MIRSAILSEPLMEARSLALDRIDQLEALVCELLHLD